MKGLFRGNCILVLLFISTCAFAGAYNREAAINYSNKWWDYPGSPDYVYYEGNNCANFVSQCLVAGDLSLSAGTDGKGAGLNEDGCIIACDNLHLHLTKYQQVKYEIGSKGESEPSWFVPGDVAILGKDSGDRWKHTVFAVAVEDNIVKYNAHSGHQYHKPITMWFDDKETDVDICYYYHIESESPPPLADWPFHQCDLANSGNNPDALSIRNPKLDEGLTIPGTSAYAQPVVEGQMVYLATTDGKVIASDMEKKLCPWFFDTGAEEIKLTPALVGNKLYVLDSNNVLWCLDKRTGNWIWYFDIVDYFGLPDYYWQTSPQVWQNNYVCLTIGPYAVFVYDDIEIASKGPKIAKLAKMPIQAQQEPPEFVATSVISKDGIFYCFDFACNAIAFEIATAGYLWHISQFPGPKDPAGLTYLGNPFAVVLADDILILKNNWRYDFQDTIPKPGETGFLYAINIKTHDKILWAREIGLTSCPSVYKDGALYSYGLFAPQEPGKIEGIVYCLDPKTGDLLTPNAISVNDDIHISIGGDVMYLSCWTFKKAFAVIFEPFEILWQQDLAYRPFSAIVPVEDKAYVSMLDIPIQSQSNKAMLWPDAKTRPLTTGNVILTSFSEAPPTFQKGDVSMDGNITAHDAKLIMEHVVGQIKLTPEQLELADISGNGQVSAMDAGMVMQITTGLKKK